MPRGVSDEEFHTAIRELRSDWGDRAAPQGGGDGSGADWPECPGIFAASDIHSGSTKRLAAATGKGASVPAGPCLAGLVHPWQACGQLSVSAKWLK